MSQAAQHIQDAEEMIRRGKFENAFECLDLALALEPKNAQAWYLKGGLYCLPEELERAVFCFETSAKYSGDLAYWPLCKLGSKLDALGRYDEAIVAFARASEIDPSRVGSWISMGLIMNDAGYYERALEVYDVALKIEPENYIIWAYRGDALRELQRFEDALDSYVKVLVFDKSSTEGNLGAAACFAEMDQADLSLEMVDLLLAQEELASILVEKALILSNLDRYGEALATIDRAIMLGLRRSHVWQKRAKILSKLGRTIESMESLERALELNPRFAPAWFAKACVLYYSGCMQEAQQAISSYFETSRGTDGLQDAASTMCRFLEASRA